MKLEEKRRFLDTETNATLPFVVEFQDGRRGEAATPLHLMDLIVHPNFSDIDDIETIYYMCVKVLRDIAGNQLAAQGIRTTVYDAVGPFYDNAIPRHIDEQEQDVEFTNNEDPVILDGWDPWTVVASLIKAGYIKVYEKYPVWSDRQKRMGCNGCVFNQENEGIPFCATWESDQAIKIWEKACFFVTNGPAYDDYHEVLPEEIVDGKYKSHWVPITYRKKEYIGYRMVENEAN